jgi:Icc-related predicted phosphoesterase
MGREMEDYGTVRLPEDESPNRPIRLLVLADLHGMSAWTGRHGAADVVVSCGNVSIRVLLEAAAAHECQTILAVRGDRDGYETFPPEVTNLHGRAHTIKGVVFGGLGGSRKTGLKEQQWGATEEQAEATLAAMPAVDVMVCHTSPRYVHDTQQAEDVGFDALHQYLERTSPRLVLHGHHRVNQVTVLGTVRIQGVYGRRDLDVTIAPPALPTGI